MAKTKGNGETGEGKARTLSIELHGVREEIDKFCEAHPIYNKKHLEKLVRDVAMFRANEGIVGKIREIATGEVKAAH